MTKPRRTLAAPQAQSSGAGRIAISLAAGWPVQPRGPRIQPVRGALSCDRRRTSNKDGHGPPGNKQVPITEPEKTVLGRATPVARERAPAALWTNGGIV